MKQQVDKLIANLLLDEGEVYLPTVGTLLLYRHAAQLLSSKLLQQPYRELRLTKEERGVSLTAHIVHTASVSAERAEDIYAEWLEQSLHGEILTINNLCTIEKGIVTTNKTFEDMANPQGRKTTKVRPRTNIFIYVLTGLCIGFALGMAGYILHANGMFDNLLSKQGIAPAAEAFRSAPQPDVIEPIEEVQSVIEDPIVEEPIIAGVEKPAIAPLQKGWSYAVWGVYSELQNAKNAVSWLSAKVPEVGEAQIYEYDGRYMVAICEVSSRSECGRKVSAWKAQHKSFKSVWVYTR